MQALQARVDLQKPQADTSVDISVDNGKADPLAAQFPRRVDTSMACFLK